MRRPVLRAAFSAAALAAALVRAAPLQAWDYAVPPAPAAVTPAPVLVLEPFRDARRNRDLWDGPTRFDRVGVTAVGLDAQDPAWRAADYGSASFLWERALGRALDAQGLPVFEAPPGARPGVGARGVLDGRITRLEVRKRGDDPVFGTDVNGDDYVFILDLDLGLRPLAPGFRGASQSWEFSHTFHDPTRFGRAPKDTFPGYFAQGLSLAADSLAKALAAFEGTAAPGGWEEYWINPRSRRRMDPTWNFDPSDGTPRSRFVEARGPAGIPVGAPVPAGTGKP